MNTAEIRYRVADFLKMYPPFGGMEQHDLLDLAQKGRVKFFEPHEYILTQGSSRFQVLVIQQGTVLLWDERGAEAKLLDVRGAGDMLGIDPGDGRTYPYRILRRLREQLEMADRSQDLVGMAVTIPGANYETGMGIGRFSVSSLPGASENRGCDSPSGRHSQNSRVSRATLTAPPVSPASYKYLTQPDWF